MCVGGGGVFSDFIVATYYAENVSRSENSLLFFSFIFSPHKKNLYEMKWCRQERRVLFWTLIQFFKLVNGSHSFVTRDVCK